MKRSSSSLSVIVPIAISVSIGALLAQSLAVRAELKLAQAPPPAGEVPPEEEKAKRKGRPKDEEPAKGQDAQRGGDRAKGDPRAKGDADGGSKQAQEKKQRQERAKDDAARAAKQAQEDKQAQEERQREERARAEEERRLQERAKDEAARAKAETERARVKAERKRKEDQDQREAERASREDADRAKLTRERKQAEENAKAEEEEVRRERAKLEQERAKLRKEREAAERERAKAQQAKQRQREEELKREQERLAGEERRLKDLEDRLKQRGDRARALSEEQRRRADELRERANDLRTTERRLERLEDVQRQRQRRVEEGGRIIIDEPDRRRIVKDKERMVIRHDESERFRLLARDVRSERRRDGITVYTFTRGDGILIVSEVDDDGRLIRRYRRTPQGRQIMLIDNSRFYRRDRAFFEISLNLPPPVIRIPRERYIVEYSRASEDEIYETLLAPPVERLARTYSLDEIRYSHELRARMRRIDLDEINFEFGSWEVTADQMPKLERLARAINRVLRRSPDEVFLIEGYTDAVGSEEDNLSLSDRRAEAVAVVLTEEFRVPPENLVTQGYGEQFLKVETEGPERANRRVAIRRITPMLSQGR